MTYYERILLSDRVNRMVERFTGAIQIAERFLSREGSQFSDCRDARRFLELMDLVKNSLEADAQAISDATSERACA